MNGYVDINLEERRNTVHKKKDAFAHQMSAFEALNNTFHMPIKGYKGALLVLPTGGGKTFTATNWICRSILSRNVKVLWLAQSSYLLNQATQSFVHESSNISHSRTSLKIRTVSSSTSHSNSGSIQLSDDVVVVTTQTAIADVLNETIGFTGESLKFKLRQWIENSSESELFVVLDEAHHAPAYGCRSLLLKLKELIPNLYIIGLTATPTHNDQRIRGWLDKIFDQGICYQADINDLYKTNILAKPVYIQKQTGKDMEVDDKLYQRIMSDHKDLPENIVDVLASDSSRNNYIINDYIQNKNEYGKTIIFADRWFQCEYIVSKLKDHGILADCIYVMSSGRKDASPDGQGRRDNKQNEAALNDFRDGRINVLVNVKMLTEGIDVPDVETVMLTRSTTSGILFTQMIGRALRGKKAGARPDKEKANIVLFLDNWKRLLPFANVADITGGVENIRSVRSGIAPMEWISILLVRRACKDIEFVGKEQNSSLFYVPTGWYETEYTVSVENEDGDEMITASNSAMVFEGNEVALRKLIEKLLMSETPVELASERISNESVLEIMEKELNGIISFNEDDIDGNLKNTVVNIVRHIAQNGTSPEFIPFEIREQYNLDQLVVEYEMLNGPTRRARLKADFENNKLLWSKLYKKFDWFWQAYNDAELRLYSDMNNQIENNQDVEIQIEVRQPENYREALMERDHKECCCCGRQFGKGVRLEVDHIIPVKMGGKTELQNLQLLCKSCNMHKGTQLISFLNNKTAMINSKDLVIIRTNAKEPVDCSVRRIINFFYRTNAVCTILFHQRSSGKFYYRWTIQLHEGNPATWLLPYKKDLLKYINVDLGFKHVEGVIIENI